MNTYDIQPFFFPTTVAFVDDSRPFLSNLSLQLDSNLAFKMFHSPFTALTALNAAAPVPPLVERFFSLYRHRGDTSYAHHVVDLSLDLIHREVYDERRFEQVSVVVVDYDMPEIDGLELCRNIKNSAVKKILLTGKANEQVAVKAFNEKVIDRFIRKQDDDAIDCLNKCIEELQYEYFQQVELTLSDTLSVGSHSFLRDPEFGARFNDIRKQLKIVEHYLACTPDGILMLDMAGVTHLLIVQSEQAVQGNYEIAFDQGAPEELLKKLRNKEMLPYFWKTAGNYSPVYKNWRDCLYPASEFISKRDLYLYTVVKNPAGFNTRHLQTYAAYLDKLDNEARENALSNA